MEAPSPDSGKRPAPADEGSDERQAKKKKSKKPVIYRLRAHANPLSDPQYPYPVSPDKVDWNKHYPEYFGKSSTPAPRVEFADIGCGFGGLLVALSTRFPDTLIAGLEIRKPVVEFVQERIEKLRKENPGKYQNIACFRCNAMKHLPNFFHKGQLSKLFFLFPDPHFKKSNHRRRIISPTLLSEYAYVLREVGGRIYTITDVRELHEWMIKHCSEHPLFIRVTDDELKQDPTVPLVETSSEESKKVDKAKGSKFLAVFERIPPPEDA